MKITKRGVLAALSVPVLAITIAACGSGNSNDGTSSENAQQTQITTNLENSQPLPSVYYSQERQNLIDIELAEVNDVQTTTFVTHQGNQDPIFSGPSIGFGIPDSASLSNPSQISFKYNNWSNGIVDSGVVDQMEPTGIYAPMSSMGTWIIFLYSNGRPYIDRWEDNTDTVGGPAEWDETHHRVVLTGAPTAAATVVNPAHAARR